MHFTLTKCSGGVKTKILNLERGCCFWTWRFNKLAKVKGSRHALEAGFCCLRTRRGAIYARVTLQNRRFLQ